MIDFVLFGGFANGGMNGRTYERTLVVVESLSRLKIAFCFGFENQKNFWGWKTSRWVKEKFT